MKVPARKKTAYERTVRKEMVRMEAATGNIKLPKYRGRKRTKSFSIKVGSTCTGAGTTEFALEDLIEVNSGNGPEVSYDVAFACEKQDSVAEFYKSHFKTECFIDNAFNGLHEDAPEVDLYSAGWPCQSFSISGHQQGEDDQRAQVIYPVLNYIRDKVPKCFFLENVENLTTKFRDHFEWLLNELIHFTRDGGEPAYEVRWRILDSAEHGSAQTRKRVYVVGLRTDCIVRPFIWPEPMDTPPLKNFLDKGGIAAGRTRYPPRQQVTANKNVRAVYDLLAKQGINARKHDVMIDTDGGRPSYSLGRVGTITASRAGGLSYWITSRNRRVSLKELLRLQGFDPKRINLEAASPRQIGIILGNAFTVTVVRRLLSKMLPAVDLAPENFSDGL